ncbi:MAG: hypothetical protein ACRDNO_08020, partial [Trebonia sp.]
MAPAESDCGLVLGYWEGWLACTAYCGGDCAAAGADDAGELTARRLWTGVRGDGVATGTTAAGELAAAGIPAAPVTGLPWLGVTVSTTAA